MRRVTTRARKALHARLRPQASRLDEDSQAENVNGRSRSGSRWMYIGIFAALATSVTVFMGRSFLGGETRTSSIVNNRTLSDTLPAEVRLIGATTTVIEVSTGLPLAARVDTGATTCAIHCEALEIEDADSDPKKNIGKPVRFLVRNKKGKSEWVESTIVDHVTVRSAAADEQRYKVRLDFRWQDKEKRVAVTLDDRQHMRYPLLLGRNFLRDDFLVSVNLGSNR